jgi:hypothetical protein
MTEAAGEIIRQPIPRFAQNADNVCGVTCVRSLIFLHSGVDLGEEPLAAWAAVEVFGYARPEMLQILLERFGFFTQVCTEQTIDLVRGYLRRDEHVILGFTHGGQQHYAVVKEMTATHITLMCPWFARKNKDLVYAFADLVKIWHVDDAIDGYGRYMPQPLMRVSRTPLPQPT